MGVPYGLLFLYVKLMLNICFYYILFVILCKKQ